MFRCGAIKPVVLAGSAGLLLSACAGFPTVESPEVAFASLCSVDVTHAAHVRVEAIWATDHYHVPSLTGEGCRVSLYPRLPEGAGPEFGPLSDRRNMLFERVGFSAYRVEIEGDIVVSGAFGDDLPAVLISKVYGITELK